MRKWMVLSATVLLAAAGTANALVSDEDTLKAVEAYTKGQEAVTKGQWDAAIPALESAIKLNPELFVANYYLGFAYQKKGNSAKAVENFKAYLQKAGSSGDPQMVATAKAVVGGSGPSADAKKGVELAKQHKYAQAIPLLNKAVAANPKDLESQYFLGFSLYQTKDHTGAEQHFNQVIQLNPKLDQPQYYAGLIAYTKKDYTTAKKRFDAFLRLSPTSKRAPQVHHLLGSILAEEGDAAGAADHFQKYLASNPTGPEADAVKKYMQDLKAAAAEGGGAN
jgi:tetratricopeptide (TPR) repeat protein